MRSKNHTVWTWQDADDVVRFAGYGQYMDKHPAIDRFEKRHEGDSELDLWLQSCDEEPKRTTFGQEVVSLEEAIGFVMGLRSKFAETLLKSRGPSSYAGGNPKKGVYRFCATDISKCEAYPSVREAAKAMECNPSTITRWCQDPKNVAWGYIDGEVET